MFGSSVEMSDLTWAETLPYMTNPPVNAVCWNPDGQKWKLEMCICKTIQVYWRTWINTCLQWINFDKRDVHCEDKGNKCPVCTTLIIVWMAEVRGAGEVMTVRLRRQLSLPRWKRPERTIKNASEIYRPAVGLFNRVGETWMVPSGWGPSVATWLKHRGTQ